MKYWLCVMNPENFEIVKDKLLWGVEARHKKYMDQVSKGDILIMYVTKQSKIKGIFKADSDPFEDETPVFSGGKYPYRVKLSVVKLHEEGIPIKELIDKLSIFKGKKNWAGAIQGKAMRELTKEDFDIINGKF